MRVCIFCKSFGITEKLHRMETELFGFRQLGQAFGDFRISGDIIGHRSVVEFFVSDHIEIARAGQAEEDGLLLAGFLAAERFVNGYADGVAAFGRGEYTLRIPSSVRRRLLPSARRHRAARVRGSFRDSAARRHGWRRG